MESLVYVLSKAVLGDHGSSAPAVGIYTVKELSQSLTSRVKTDALFENIVPVGGLFLQEGQQVDPAQVRAGPRRSVFLAGKMSLGPTQLVHEFEQNE
jgi:hypothetical protein